MLTNIDVLVGRLITREISGGFIRHKTGPGHNDFSEPFEIRYKPAEESRVKWLKPVIVLTNRSCFSSANDFVATVKGLDSIWIVGAKTGGGEDFRSLRNCPTVGAYASQPVRLQTATVVRPNTE